MACDLSLLVSSLSLGPVSLVGHSMGGRTTMLLALQQEVALHKVLAPWTQPRRSCPVFDCFFLLFLLDKVVVVDISPVNQTFDVTSSNEWNMEHYFHCLKAVTFDQSLSISAARFVVRRTKNCCCMPHT